MLTGTVSPREFLARYWQKQVLFSKNAFPDFQDPLSPEELAGLACEPDVDARLVFTRKSTWDLQSGPFAEHDFTSLPARNWTLLVQAVDQWVPAVKDLLHSVTFLPSWRVDDVMISYATPRGGVGPHFDYYDVFLMQGQGSRLWKTGQHCTSRDVSRGRSGLKLLKEFHCEQEWLLETGDVLYVPPGVAHWGTSLDNSLCYSIGFRAPSVSEMLLSFSDMLAERHTEDERYTDRRLKPVQRPGEIDASALRHARLLLKEALGNEQALAVWFGCYMTEPKYADLVEPPSALPDLRQEDLLLVPNSLSRFAWQQHGSTLLVFADGACFDFPVSAPLLKLATLLPLPDAVIPARSFHRNAACCKLLEALLAQGSLLAEDAG